MNSTADEKSDSLSDVMARLSTLTADAVADPDLKNVEQAVERIEPRLPSLKVAPALQD